MGLETIKQPQQFDNFIAIDGSRAVTQSSGTLNITLSSKNAIVSSNNLFVYDPINAPTNPLKPAYIEGGNYRIGTGSTFIFGTNSDQHLRIRTGGSSSNEIRMTVLSSGEVGIGTTIARTNQQAQLSGTRNGTFADVTGMTPNTFPNPDWFGGTVPNWTGPVDAGYTVYYDTVKLYRNLLAGPTSSANRMEQTIGTLQVRSDVIVRFTNSFIPGPINGTLSAAIFNSSLASLASGAYDGFGTYALSAANVPAGTKITIGFWGNTGITDINLSTTLQSGYLTINGGLSAGYMSASRFEVQDGYVVLKNLPNVPTDLPSGAIYIDSGFLAIVP